VGAHQEVFAWVLTVLGKEGLLRGQTIGVDATTLEANAAMKSIVRRDTGESYGEFLRRLAEESGESTPTRAELARKDKKRKGKGSNDDWTNPLDPETVQPADRGDTQSLKATLEETLENLAVVVEQVELPE
jgi:transposase